MNTLSRLLTIRILFISVIFATFVNGYIEVDYYNQQGIRPGDNSVVGGYDLNKDGIVDIIVGVEGFLEIFYNYSDPNHVAFTIMSPQYPTDNFGQSIAVGDCDGNGYLDIFVGAPSNDRVYGYYGSSQGFHSTPNITLSGPSQSSFGWALAFGDCNNDNKSDLLVGAPSDSTSTLNGGGAYVYFGNVSGVHTVAGWYTYGAVNSSFGYSVAFLDQTSDGYDDAVVAAPTRTSDGGQSGAGGFFVYNGSYTGPYTPGSFLSDDNPQENARLGTVVKNVGDTNADGYDDLAVVIANLSDAGGLLMYHGGQSGLHFSGIQLTGNSTIWPSIQSVAPVGDINKDNYSDISVGGWGSWAIATGARGGINVISTPWRVDNSTLISLGNVAGYAGDVDNDGYLDILEAAPYDDYVVVYRSAGTPIVAVSPVPLMSMTPSSTSDTGRPSTDKAKLQIHIIEGAVGAALLLSLIGIIIAVVLIKRRKNRNLNNPKEPEEDPKKSEERSPDVVPLQPTHYESRPLAHYEVATPEEPKPTEPAKEESHSREEKRDSAWVKAKEKSEPVEVKEVKKKDEVVAKAEELLAQQWEISYKDIKIGTEIGRGGFGVVYRARWMNSDCVVKQLNISQSDKKAVDDFLKEASTVRFLRNHQNVCTIFGVCTNPQYPICIVMEFVSGGNLQKLIFDKLIQLDSHTILKIARDITGGMSFLHRVNILHCDLACRNLLVAKDGNNLCVKITDFGLSHISQSEVYDASKKTLFPIRWSAPEVLMQHKLSRASDVWSFGIVMWEVLEAKLPYYKLDNTEVIEYVCEKKKVLSKPAEIPYPPQIYDIMLKCWSFDPTQRPSFEELCDIFTQMDENLEVSENVISEENNDNDGRGLYGGRSMSTVVVPDHLRG